MTAPRAWSASMASHVDHHRVEHPRLVARRVPLAQIRGGFQREPAGDVADPEVVRRGLVGDHVGDHTAADQLRQHLGDVADQPDRERARRLAPGLDQLAAPRRARC